jgi:hypothetical protein
MPMTSDPALEPLNRLVGTWTTEATHPAIPGVVVNGVTIIEWWEGERFLILRARTDHPEFPDAISIIGFTDRDRVDDPPRIHSTAAKPPLSMHSFDSRGVFRVLDVDIDDESWRLSREASGFSQRFTGRFTDSGDTIVGRWQLCQDQLRWDDDLEITYRRRR